MDINIDLTILHPGRISATVMIMSLIWATPVSPGYPTRIIALGECSSLNLLPTPLMVLAKASPIIRVPSGIMMVSVTMYVPAGKYTSLHPVCIDRMVLMLAVSSV